MPLEPDHLNHRNRTNGNSSVQSTYRIPTFCVRRNPERSLRPLTVTAYLSLNSASTGPSWPAEVPRPPESWVRSNERPSSSVTVTTHRTCFPGEIVNEQQSSGKKKGGERHRMRLIGSSLPRGRPGKLTTRSTNPSPESIAYRGPNRDQLNLWTIFTCI